MTQLGVAYSERVSSAGASTSATYVALSTPKLLAASLVTGKSYLILARGEFHRDSVSGQSAVDLTHGSTEFPGSEMIFTTPAAGTLVDNVLWSYATVWTAVAGEDVSVRVHGDGAAKCEGRFISLLAIKLSDDLVLNTDYFTAESVANTTLTTSLQTGATLTFTPGTGGHQWLVITDATLEQDSVSDYFASRLDHTGGATENWEYQVGGRSAGETRTYPNMHVLTLGAVSQTLREQAKRVGTSAATARRTRSFVFALDLSKLDVASVATSDTKIDLTSGFSGSLVESVTHAQVIGGGNVLFLAFGVYEPTGDTARRYQSGFVRLNGIDAFSADGATNTYEVEAYRLYYPGISLGSQSFPYWHMSLDVADAGSITVDLRASVSAAAAGRGMKFFRVLALSLDVAGVAPPAGAGGTPSLERNEQIMYTDDYRASRRRVRVRVVDATDNVTPETAEAGGQAAISVNGGAFTTTGVGVLVAIEASNGLYYAELTQAALAVVPGSSLTLRYKSAATALFTVTLAVEELPWLDDGTAAAGGANTITLEATAGEHTRPATLAAGSIIRLTAGTGAGQSQLVASYASGVATMEQNWTTAPDATTKYRVLPGLPPITPAVNVAQIGGSATAAGNLQAGAEAMLTFTVVAGTNNTGTVTTNLPVIVGGVATPTDFYKDRTIYFRSGSTGSLIGDSALITGSVVSGGNTVLTVATLAAAPTVGATGVVA